jgi:DNA-binding transcriptional regulator LsrR (DeoR family)
MIHKNNLLKLLKQLKREEICDILNVSSRTLDRMIAKHSLTRKNYGRKNITYETVKIIKNLYSTGFIKQKELAKKFNVTQSLISKIVNNQVHKNTINITGCATVRLEFKNGN